MSRLALVALVLLPPAALVTRALWTASTERAGVVRGLDHVLTVASFDGGTAFLAALLTVGLARRVTRGPRVEAAS